MQSPLPELWGGVECTINRVQDRYFDQLARSGHRERCATDLRCIAEVGLQTLRVALHWERFEATQSWVEWDGMLATMQALNLRPIVGLLHHGSGPPSTDLLDPAFPERLAAYAELVARRYPHVLDWTPVNEPQTTGRFSCLYGHWYPHHRDMRSYARALCNQLKGVVLAMQAIRRVQPEARLIHTEDAGATYATPVLEAFRAEREQRRWAGADLLCGLVTRDHPLFAFLVEHGIAEEEVFWFSENACPPSVLGLNYYVTSDRFLDHRLELYPGLAGGDTGTEPLVDTEAVRVRPEGITGVHALLCEAWERYRLPVAITEAHLGCFDTREQVRWLAEVWQSALSAQAEGVDVQAVTVWALLGSFDWCRLCTEDLGDYEPGIFDLREGRLAPTPLVGVVQQIIAERSLDHDALQHGWWHRPERLTVPAPSTEEPTDAEAECLSS